MKVYLVGGRVRDKLLRIEPRDCDYVVVGSTPEELLSLGFKQVGADFPVFLHPETKEEYALARTEVKNGVGYQGFNCDFNPSITLEEDLARRDLTINAMAMDTETGEIIDPFDGQRDLKVGVLRPTTEAFCQDPLRVFRAARFLARYPNFKPDPEGMLFSLSDKVSGEFSSISPERVWLETEKALSEKKPSRYFEWLSQWDIFDDINNMKGLEQPVEHHPEGDVFQHTMLCIDFLSGAEQRFACLLHDVGKYASFKEYGNFHGHEAMGVKYVHWFCDKWRVPNKFRKLAAAVCEHHTRCHKVLEMKPSKVMKLLEMIGAEKNPEFFAKFVECCAADSMSRGEEFYARYAPGAYIMNCFCTVCGVDTKKISTKMLAEGKSGKAIGEAIRVAKIAAIRSIDKSKFI